MNEFFQMMLLPFVTCLILTGIHAYLGFHVIERQVIFVDLALAQVAVLGSGVALLLGYPWDSSSGYWLSLIFTIVGAGIFALTRFRKQKVPQEAIIGITYAVSAAMLLIIFSRFGEGDEYVRQSLVGNVLLVSPDEILKITLIYSIVGILHFVWRKKFFLISQNPQEAFRQGLNVRMWDFIFYGLFGLVVTSSVQLVGVLLVFSFLVVPPVCAVLLTDQLRLRLILGWGIGFLASVVGISVSYYGDFPTGAAIVVVFGILILLIAGIKRLC